MSKEQRKAERGAYLATFHPALGYRRVRVTAGDYSYDGWLVVTFLKQSGQTRCVVEDDNGRLFIHNPTQVAQLPVK